MCKSFCVEMCSVNKQTKKNIYITTFLYAVGQSISRWAIQLDNFSNKRKVNERGTDMDQICFSFFNTSPPLRFTQGDEIIL